MRWENLTANASLRENPYDGVLGPGKRWGHSCNSVQGGKFIYVFGGYSTDSSHRNDLHVFDTSTQTWSKPMVKGDPPCPRDSHSCTTVGNNLFVFGGTNGEDPLGDLYILDTSSNTWISPSVLGEEPEAREGHSAALIGKQLFIFGGSGRAQNNSDEVYYNDLYILDTEAFEWRRSITSGTPPSARDSHACSSWKNKIVVVAGVSASGHYLSDVHLLDTDTLVWEELCTSGQVLPPRAGHSTIALGRDLFVIGGYTNNQNLFDDLHMLNIETGIWTKVVAVGEGPSPRFSVAGDCLHAQKGVLVFIGGCDEHLESLDDMYYLHTEILMENEQREKSSLLKELKRKCQEQRLSVSLPVNNTDVRNLRSVPDMSRNVVLPSCGHPVVSENGSNTNTVDYGNRVTQFMDLQEKLNANLASQINSLDRQIKELKEVVSENGSNTGGVDYGTRVTQFMNMQEKLNADLASQVNSLDRQIKELKEENGSNTNNVDYGNRVTQFMDLQEKLNADMASQVNSLDKQIKELKEGDIFTNMSLPEISKQAIEGAGKERLSAQAAIREAPNLGEHILEGCSNDLTCDNSNEFSNKMPNPSMKEPQKSKRTRVSSKHVRREKERPRGLLPPVSNKRLVPTQAEIAWHHLEMEKQALRMWSTLNALQRMSQPEQQGKGRSQSSVLDPKEGPLISKEGPLISKDNNREREISGGHLPAPEELPSSEPKESNISKGALSQRMRRERERSKGLLPPVRKKFPGLAPTRAIISQRLRHEMKR